MQRPESVPASATWDASDNEWVLAPLDDDGEKSGLVRWWRPDGTLCCATEYDAGIAQGSFERFHEDGTTSRSGRFEDGQLHGTNTFQRSDAPTSETFPAGLAGAVWRAEMDYVQGRIVEARAYDREGNRVLEDGSPFPTDRPEGVPASAHFRKREADGEWRWVDGRVRDLGDGTLEREGTWRFWTPVGVLVGEEAYQGGALHGLSRIWDPESGALLQETPYEGGSKHGEQRTFDALGAVVERVTWQEGAEDGPFQRAVEPERYADDRIVGVRGRSEGGQVVDLELLDAAGAVVARAHPGAKPDQQDIAAVLEAVDPSLPDALRARDQHTVAFLAAVRAGTDPAELQRLLAALQPPLSEEARMRQAHRAKMVASNVIRFGGGPVQVLSSLLDGIREGGDAAELLRQAAASCDDLGAEGLATEWIDAACRLEPDHVGHEYTRALIRMSLGDPEGARESIARLGTDEGWSDAFRMMSSYCAALFADWSAPLDADPRMTMLAEIADVLEPSRLRSDGPELAVLQRAVQQAATRLGHVRDVLIERFGPVDWVPPALDALLPTGAVEVPLPEGSGIGLLHEARRDWLRLRWLCWTLGMDDVGLPEAAGPDPSRPSRALAFTVLARALVLQGDDVDVSGWMQGADPDVIARVSGTLAEGAPASRWYGLPLSECDRASAEFAHGDEMALFSMLVQWWGASEGRTYYEEADDGEE